MFTAVGVAASRKSRLGRSRRLVLVDIENVVGGVPECSAQVVWAQQHLARLIPPGLTDLVVIGTCHRGLLTVACEWAGVRYVVGSGPDGADLALLEVLGEQVAARFSEVVLVPGDGIFAESGAALGKEGVKVVVVAHRDGLSERLRMAAAQSLSLPARWSQSLDDHGDAA